MVGAEFAGGQHRFHLADKVRECFIQLPAFDVTELAGDAGPVWPGQPDNAVGCLPAPDGLPGAV